MIQYCRYCNNMVCGDANYCSVKRKTFSESQICRANKCKDFEFNEIDALGMTNGYKPREAKKKNNFYEQFTTELRKEELKNDR